MNLIALCVLLLFGQSTAPPKASEVYYVVFLRPSPSRKPIAKEEAERIQSAHMANIHKMADEHLLVAAGPFDDDQPTTISGLFLFRVASLDEARRVAMQDPTVVADRNTVDVHAWRGPSGIGDEYVRLHKLNPETREGMGVQPLFLIAKGPKWASQNSQELTAHTDYLAQLQQQGKVGMWGLTASDPDISEIVVFNRVADEEAQRLMAADPAVQAKVLQTEFHRWWCAEHVIPH